MASGSKTLETDNWIVGELIWAHLEKKQWWPGVIVNFGDVGLPPPNKNQQLIFWFGDYRISKVYSKNICLFQKSFATVYQPGHKNLGMRWLKGVTEEIKECCPKPDMESDDLIKWALNGFKGIKKSRNTIYSEFVKSKLDKIDEINKDKSESFDAKLGATSAQKGILKAIVSGKRTLESICLCCYSLKVRGEHPFFEGSICKFCKFKLKNTIHSIGTDGVAYYCTICGSPGETIICDSPSCGKVFCIKCIDELALPGARDDIMKQNPWMCFLCQKIRNGLIKPRSDWNLKIQHLIHNSSSTVLLIPSPQEKKHKLRVLSLFDGIGTALLALDKLNIAIGDYYACEIDDDALNVTRSHLTNRITNLGDIKNLSKDKIKDIGRIDLLIGGALCNDWSTIDDTGFQILVFEYYRVLITLQAVSDAPFFWLFENVTSMPIEIKLLTNNLFGCEPVVIDTTQLTQRSRRFFWGNLPTFQNYMAPNEGAALEECLMPGQSDAVAKSHTMGTRSNPLRRGHSMLASVLNVNKEKKNNILITDLEAAFGFPQHFTDTADLTIKRRQQLIERAWSIPVKCDLFKFLRDYCEITK